MSAYEAAMARFNARPDRELRIRTPDGDLRISQRSGVWLHVGREIVAGYDQAAARARAFRESYETEKLLAARPMPAAPIDRSLLARITRAWRAARQEWAK